MIPYWVLFFMAAWQAIARMRPIYAPTTRNNDMLIWVSFGVVLTAMIGLRYEVGGDWYTYLEHVERTVGQSIDNILKAGDPAYGVLNWIGANIGGGIYFVNVVSAIVFTAGLIVFCRAQPRPWLALTVSIPYLIVVVAMGYTRQAVAIGLAMLAIVAVLRGRFVSFVGWIVCAALFHKTAVILISLAVFSARKNRFVVAAGVVAIGGLLYVLLLQEAISDLQYGYLDREYSSSGAEIRVAMNVVPGLLFLALGRRFRLDARVQQFWLWMSVGAVLFVPLLIFSPSSTAVDRLALYWIPLQLFVLPRLPDALGAFGARNPSLTFSVVTYSALVLFVWLFFASHAYLWVPYQFYPLVYIFGY